MSEKPEITSALGLIGNAFYANYFMMVVVYNSNGGLRSIDIEIQDNVIDT